MHANANDSWDFLFVRGSIRGGSIQILEKFMAAFIVPTDEEFWVQGLVRDIGHLSDGQPVGQLTGIPGGLVPFPLGKEDVCCE